MQEFSFLSRKHGAHSVGVLQGCLSDFLFHFILFFSGSNETCQSSQIQYSCSDILVCLSKSTPVWYVFATSAIGSACILLRVCVCVLVAPGSLHVVVILGLMKEFSASPLHRSPRPGLGLGKERKMGFGGGWQRHWGDGYGGEGGRGKKSRINSGIKAFLCGFDFFPK